MTLSNKITDRLKWLPNTSQFSKMIKLTNAPKNEVKFNFLKNQEYNREIWKDLSTSHMFNVTSYKHKQFYEDDWVTSTYRNMTGVENTFNKIISYNFNNSDNKQRSDRVDNFCIDYGLNKSICKALDVGSGLAVFPYEMKKKGWDISVCEPDSRLIDFAKSKLGISGFKSDFLDLEEDLLFNLLTFNKVLEHIENPESFLLKAKKLAANNCLFYIEVPDAETAEMFGYEREEFFIDHMHVFSILSISYLARYCKLKILKIERIKEPSGKFSIYVFLCNE
jgi:2-polyprenyl-3-methyl-5-hydroxy-6-metoxy-1,4-benzoquinol methylase